MYFEKNNYIDNSEDSKDFECFGFYGEKFLNKLVKGGILEAVGEKKGRKYRKNKI